MRVCVQTGDYYLVDVHKDNYAFNLEKDDFEVFKPMGCTRCTNGYKGRFAIFETMRMTDTVRRMVVERAHIADIKKQALSDGMVTLRKAALANAARGKTSIEEVMRVTMDD